MLDLEAIERSLTSRRSDRNRVNLEDVKLTKFTKGISLQDTQKNNDLVVKRFERLPNGRWVVDVSYREDPQPRQERVRGGRHKLWKDSRRRVVRNERYNLWKDSRGRLVIQIDLSGRGYDEWVYVEKPRST